MRVRVLGCSAGIGAGLRTTALLINEDILVDCGTGVGDLELGALRKLRHVFFTHAHFDHVAAFPLLIDSMFDHFKRRPLIVHCRAETYQALRRHIFNWTIWPNFFDLPSRAAPAVTFEPLSPGEFINIGGGCIESIAVNHTVPAAAYRIEGPRAALAFSGDTTTNDTFWAALNRHEKLDVLLVECAFPEAQKELSRASGHYCPSRLATDLAKLKDRPHLYITHLKPGAERVTVEEIRRALPEFKPRPLRGGEIFEL